MPDHTIEQIDFIDNVLQCSKGFQKTNECLKDTVKILAELNSESLTDSGLQLAQLELLSMIPESQMTPEYKLLASLTQKILMARIEDTNQRQPHIRQLVDVSSQLHDTNDRLMDHLKTGIHGKPKDTEVHWHGQANQHQRLALSCFRCSHPQVESLGGWEA